MFLFLKLPNILISTVKFLYDCSIFYFTRELVLVLRSVDRFDRFDRLCQLNSINQNVEKIGINLDITYHIISVRTSKLNRNFSLIWVCACQGGGARWIILPLLLVFP